MENYKKVLTKRYFLQHKDELADLIKVYKLKDFFASSSKKQNAASKKNSAKTTITVWIYLLKDDFKFHHMNIGITIPNKVVKKAVERNRLKRKIREFFRPFLQKNKRLFIWVRVG